MKSFLAFLNNLDARAWRTAWVSIAMLVVVCGLIVLGKTSGAFGLSEELDGLLEGLREGPWGLPVTIALFSVAAYFGAPQFMLIGACVVAFGPVNGFLYSWAGTLVSGALTFFTGRLVGVEFVRRRGGGRMNRLSQFIGRNDFLASLIVRNLPTAPFIVVNMVFGASHASFWRYMAGLAIGVIPKTLLVALLGQSAAAAIGGAPLIAGGLLLSVAGIWVAAALTARRAVRAVQPLQEAVRPGEMSESGTDVDAPQA